jgi:hypothetical protein
MDILSQALYPYAHKGSRIKHICKIKGPLVTALEILDSCIVGLRRLATSSTRLHCVENECIAAG